MLAEVLYLTPMRTILHGIGTLLRFIYTVYAFAVYLPFLLTGFIWALVLSLLLGKRAHLPIFIYYKFWAYTWFLLVGIRYSVKGREYLRQATPCIIAGNHSTNLDLMNAAFMLPLRTKALAKSEIKKMPVLGYLFGTVSVFVDRKSKESRERSVQMLKQKLDEGFSIFIYPEGTRNRTTRPLGDFYDGAFRMAIETGRPILPVCVINGRALWPVHAKLIRPGWMKAIYLPPVATAGLTDTDVPALRDKVYRMMEECIVQEDPAFRKGKLS